MSHNSIQASGYKHSISQICSFLYILSLLLTEVLPCSYKARFWYEAGGSLTNWGSRQHPDVCPMVSALPLTWQRQVTSLPWATGSPSGLQTLQGREHLTACSEWAKDDSLGVSSQDGKSSVSCYPHIKDQKTSSLLPNQSWHSTGHAKSFMLGTWSPTIHSLCKISVVLLSLIPQDSAVQNNAERPSISRLHHMWNAKSPPVEGDTWIAVTEQTLYTEQFLQVYLEKECSCCLACITQATWTKKLGCCSSSSKNDLFPWRASKPYGMCEIEKTWGYKSLKHRQAHRR